MDSILSDRTKSFFLFSRPYYSTNLFIKCPALSGFKRRLLSAQHQGPREGKIGETLTLNALNRQY